MNRPIGVYWKPNDAFIDELVAYIGQKKVLEIFAGNGYLAKILMSRDVNIISTSLFTGHDAHEQGMHTFVAHLEASDAIHVYGADRDILLMSWPTTTPQALDAIRVWGSSSDIIYIGEVTDYAQNHLGGCATDEFFDAIEIKHEFKSYDGNRMEHALVVGLKDDL